MDGPQLGPELTPQLRPAGDLASVVNVGCRPTLTVKNDGIRFGTARHQFSP
ncbi:MAG TPA: hypothetical protein VHW44_03855 [Pseudonocardiaceae bacterium]|jgi:hypothetical protein|nr:hypothetical protein [Pseudonocardiaceae bacterium]